MARPIAVAEPRTKAARQMRATAGLLDDHHPEMMAGDHLRDAATLTAAGRLDGAKRHLDAAMFMLTPQSLIRHGILDDDGHADAKHHMHQINRHRLAVEDIEDITAANQRAASMARAARGEPEPMQPFDRPPPEFVTVGQPAHGSIVAANSSPAILLAHAPYRYRHGWVPISEQVTISQGWSKAEDSEHLDGQQVLGTDAHGHTFIGTYQHPGLVVPRHGSKLQASHVRPVTDVDRITIQREQQRRNAVRSGLMRAPGGLSNVRPAIQLSARTPFLARTPAPRGRPGGPGLYHVQGMGHTPYLQQVVKALIEKRGMRPDKAYAIARAAIRKWSVRSRHPEVKGAATAAEAGELARQARAKMSHSNDWTVADCLVELACDYPAATVIDLFNPYHAPTGQFTTASGAGQGAGKQQGKAAKRQHLVRQIASLHQQIAALRAQLPRTGKSRSSTPAKRGAAATSAKQAAQAKATAAKPGKAGAPAKARKPGMSAATIHAKIAALRAELQADIAALRALK